KGNGCATLFRSAVATTRKLLTHRWLAGGTRCRSRPPGACAGRGTIQHIRKRSRGFGRARAAGRKAAGAAPREIEPKALYSGALRRLTEIGCVRNGNCHTRRL